MDFDSVLVISIAYKLKTCEIWGKDEVFNALFRKNENFGVLMLEKYSNKKIN